MKNMLFRFVLFGPLIFALLSCGQDNSNQDNSNIIEVDEVEESHEEVGVEIVEMQELFNNSELYDGEIITISGYVKKIINNVMFIGDNPSENIKIEVPYVDRDDTSYITIAIHYLSGNYVQGRKYNFIVRVDKFLINDNGSKDFVCELVN